VTKYVQSKETNFRMKLAKVDKRTGRILKILN
jgi:hypothetical protein